MSFWKRKNVNAAAIVAVCLVGIFSDFGADVDFEGRKLQLDQSAAPAKGMSKAQSGLSDAEWTAFTTIDDQPGCKNENSCNQCRAYCTTDDDCYGILKCQAREGASNPVPGCTVPDDGFAGSVCYNPESEYYPPSPDPTNPLVTSYSPSCSVDAPCEVCGGMCDLGQDGQCARGLRCSYFNNKWPTGRKNCAYNGVRSSTKGYCMPAEDFVEPTSNNPTPSPDWDPSIPDRGELIILPECPAEGCPVCAAPFNNQNGCTADTQCAGDLVCYNEHEKTDTKREQVSGCSSNKVWRYGYCYTKDPLFQPPEIKHLETPPSNDKFILTNEIAEPDECAIYAVDPDSKFDVPIGGSSDVSLKQVLFHKVTYIYVVDASKSTKTYQANADCGDANSDNAVKHVIDCEILAIQTANDAANAGGNVDLVGLVKFNNQAEIMQGLIEPWAKLGPDRRDAAVVELARTITPKEATNFEAGVEQACTLARDPQNDNEQTVVIFVSDGAPNLGVSSRDTILNNCGGAIFQTYAVTEDADCDVVDEANLRPGIDNPDTLREISTFSGGTCTQVPDVSKLPELLIQLEKTTWDGVVVMVNGVADRSATINYSKQPSFDAPGSVTYSGTVPLPPGEHKVCLQARSSTSGVVDIAETCKTIVVEAIEANPGFQQVPAGNDAKFEVRFVGLKPGCDSFENKVVTVELCDGSKEVTTATTDANGSVTLVVKQEPGAKETCYKVCHTAANKSKSCTTTTVEYEELKTSPPVPYPTAPPVETKPPVPAETKPPVSAPVPAETKPPVPAPVPAETKPPVPADTKPPVPAPTPPIDGGVNGDPLIMGLSGQLFKFDGRNGAWYSAVSTPSFQWNMKINSYETCPNHSDTFVSGAGFSFLKNGKITKSIAVNVVNNYNVDVGCGHSDTQNCLGFGSLELIIDGVKHVVGGDYKTKDGLARITAFNTFYQCSRKWYDFEVRPQSTISEPTIRSGRSLSTPESPSSVFEVIGGLKDTMIDHQECQKWINDRQAYGDIFMQPGHYSTVIINTADVTLHLEYKQENQRCNAHSIDVWISSVSPRLLDEPWEGVIGETKDPSYISVGESMMVDRSVALKHAKDKDYEVNSPFSTKCKGCNHR